MGCTSRYKLWILKFMAQNGCFVKTKKVLLRHGSYLCSSALIVAYSFLSSYLLQFCHDIISFCCDIVLLMFSVLCCDMVVFYRDTNFLIQLFNFVAAVSAMLQHSFCCYSQFMSRLTFICRDNVFPNSMDLLS